MNLHAIRMMCLTPRAAQLLRQAVLYSDASGISPLNPLVKGDLNYALALHRQCGGGDLYLFNDPAMRGMVVGIAQIAAETGPAELRSSFRTLQGVLEKFGMIQGRDDVMRMTRRLEAESSEWRWRGCRQDELPVLYEEVYKPLARMVREKADVIMKEEVDRWARVLVRNSDVIDAFRRHEGLERRCGDVFDGLHTVLGIQSLHNSFFTIYTDIFRCDEEDTMRALTVEDRDDVTNMVTFDYSLSGLYVMSAYGEDAVLQLGRGADYVRRKKPSAVTYLKSLEGEFDTNPVAEHCRLRLLWYAIRNVGTLSDELDGLLRDVCRKMADLDHRLLARAARTSALA